MRPKEGKLLPQRDTWKYGYFHIDVLQPEYHREHWRIAREDHRKWQALVEGAASRLGVSITFFPGAWRKRGKTGLTWAEACRRARYLVQNIIKRLCVHTFTFDLKADMVAYWLLEKPTSEVFAAFKSASESLGFERVDWTEPNWAEMRARRW